MKKLSETFDHLALLVADVTGSVWAFVVAFLVIILWGITGPFLHFSATWQLVINTGTTIITFLMVFLLQNAQSRDTKAIQVKLDELIRAVDNADNRVMGIEKKRENLND